MKRFRIRHLVARPQDRWFIDIADGADFFSERGFEAVLQSNEVQVTPAKGMIVFLCVSEDCSFKLVRKEGRYTETIIDQGISAVCESLTEENAVFRGEGNYMEQYRFFCYGEAKQGHHAIQSMENR